MTRTEKHILAEVRKLAVEYHQLTGKSLGVTGEIGEFEAAEKMGLELRAARAEGYDAVRHEGGYRRIQIKSRWKRNGTSWGRVARIDISKEFDSVMLVLMHGDYEVYEIWEAGRQDVVNRLTMPGSKSRNERGQMGVSQFKAIAKKVWSMGKKRMQAQPTRQESSASCESSSDNKVCPECGHVFQGNGWVGIDAHWKSKHEHILPYEKAWPLLSSGNYEKELAS